MNSTIANDNYVDDNDDGSNEPSLLMLTVDAAVEQLTKEAEDQADLDFIATRLITHGFVILCNRTSYGIAGAVAYITRLIRLAPKEPTYG